MSKAQEENPVKQYFKDGKLPRLELAMMPKDYDRALGSTRTALVNSFNYCRSYPKKLDLFIEVLKFTVNMAMMYRAEMKLGVEKAEKIKAEVAEEKRIAAEKAEAERLEVEEKRLTAQLKEVQAAKAAKVKEGDK